MSSRTILLFLFAWCGASACAVDWGSFVANSDRGDDPVILDIMEGADLSAKVQMCEALGSRTDPYAGDILSWLLARFSHSSAHESELLVRVAMKSLFNNAPDDQVRSKRIQANSGFLDGLVKTVGTFHDPMLKDSVIRLLPYLDRAIQLPALMEIGADIESKLRQNTGAISAAETGLAYDYVSAVEAIGTPDFLESCLAIARLSRDKHLTQKAQAVSRLLAGSGS